MSFVGAIASSARKILANYTQDIKMPCLLVGAGNFTVASTLRSGGYAGPINSCDVSLYTSALGAYLSNGKIAISEKPECPDHLKGLLSTRPKIDIAASIALLYALREVWQIKNPYQERIFLQYKENWSDLMEATKEKLKDYKKHIGEIKYQAEDGFEFLEKQDREKTVFAFPPTYKRGYEKLEKLLREVVTWDPPEYKEMTDKSMELYEIVAGFAAYYVVLEKELPEVYKILGEPAAVLPRGIGKNTYILAKKASKKFVIKKTIKSMPIGPLLPPEYSITGEEEISLVKLSLAQSIRLNELYLASNIDYFSGGVGLSLGYTLDGQLFGKADFTRSSFQWKLPEEKPCIYIMSDLAVISKIRKLSKLILLCILSTKTKELLDLQYIEDFGYALTTAFSKHPVSMKYRGLFKLHKRKEEEKGFILNYFAPFGEHTLQESLEIWNKKYNKG